MYFHGYGVRHNRIESFAWRKVAERNGITIILKKMKIRLLQEPDELKIKNRYYVIWEEVHAKNSMKVFHEGTHYYDKWQYGNAITHFHIAADRGNAMARYYLGCMYYDRTGVSVDYDAAFKWIMS